VARQRDGGEDPLRVYGKWASLSWPYNGLLGDVQPLTPSPLWEVEAQASRLTLGFVDTFVVGTKTWPRLES